MKNYTIIEQDPIVRKKIEDIIKEFDLDQRIHIVHPPEGKTCGVEVTYQIAEGWTREGLTPRGTLMIYVNDERPRIFFSRNIRQVVFHTDFENTDYRIATCIMEPVLIEVYSDKGLDCISEHKTPYCRR